MLQHVVVFILLLRLRLKAHLLRFFRVGTSFRRRPRSHNVTQDDLKSSLPYVVGILWVDRVMQVFHRASFFYRYVCVYIAVAQI